MRLFGGLDAHIDVIDEEIGVQLVGLLPVLQVLEEAPQTTLNAAPAIRGHPVENILRFPLKMGHRCW